MTRWEPGINCPDALDVTVSLAAGRMVDRFRCGDTAAGLVALTVPPFADEHGTPCPEALQMLVLRLAVMAAHVGGSVTEGPAPLGSRTLIDYP